MKGRGASSGKCQHNQGAYLYCGTGELSGDDYVQVSQNAASQPEVKLGLQKGEQYYLEDLLYSLMLKSHNDTAVAIAEHCGEAWKALPECLTGKQNR